MSGLLPLRRTSCMVIVVVDCCCCCCWIRDAGGHRTTRPSVEHRTPSFCPIDTSHTGLPWRSSTRLQQQQQQQRTRRSDLSVNTAIYCRVPASLQLLTAAGGRSRLEARSAKTLQQQQQQPVDCLIPVDCVLDSVAQCRRWNSSTASRRLRSTSRRKYCT